MPKLTDTYARAVEACDLILFETGKFPTIDSVRDRIGVNSPTTINKAIKHWTEAFAKKHYEKKTQPDVPTVLFNAVEAVWRLAVTQAQQAYALKEIEFQQQIADLNQLLSHTREESERNRQGLEEALALLQEAHANAGEMQEAIDHVDKESNDKTFRISQLEFQLQETNARHESEKKDWDATRESDHAWSLKRIEEEKELAANRWQDKVGQLNNTVAALKESEGALRQSAYLARKDVDVLNSRIKELEADLDRMRLDQAMPFKRKLDKRKILGRGVN